MFVPYDADFRRRIEAALDVAKSIVERRERPGDLAALEREITWRHAKAVSDFIGRHGPVDLVGFHGQTVLHRPEQALTVQLGDGAFLARETGIGVVYDMRAADMEAGGQGAPLVPAYHAALAAKLSGIELPVCFVNIGGISNITFVSHDAPPIAFDSGPGNGLIDQWVAKKGGVPFDQDGAIAGRGSTVERVVERYMQNPFFARTGPKSLDRSDFTLDNADGLELADGARTLAAVTACAILKAAEHLPQTPKAWVLCGGGRKNPHIVSDMREGAATSGAQVLLADEVGLDGDAIEAQAWAYLAVRATKRLPLTWPTTTGCNAPVSGGVLAQP